MVKVNLLEIVIMKKNCSNTGDKLGSLVVKKRAQKLIKFGERTPSIRRNCQL